MVTASGTVARHTTVSGGGGAAGWGASGVNTLKGVLLPQGTKVLRCSSLRRSACEHGACYDCLPKHASAGD